MVPRSGATVLQPRHKPAAALCQEEPVAGHEDGGAASEGERGKEGRQPG